LTRPFGHVTTRGFRLSTSTARVAEPYGDVEDICPQLAVNLGWLRLIADALIEQKSRQTDTTPPPVSVQQLTWIERRRASRKANKRRRRTLQLTRAIMERRA
jgi:hypothetical protein